MSNIYLNKDNAREEREMRKVYIQTLLELIEQNKNIVHVDADLGLAIGAAAIGEKYPENLVDCGIQEANMMGVACGMSVQGKIPFAHSFAPFATRRAADQIYMSGAYNKANVRIIGTDPGIIAAMNGGTHMPFDDVGIMRGIPEMTIVEPTDSIMLVDLMKQTVNMYGMTYIRLTRKRVTKVYEEGSSFEIGKAVKLREGSDVTIIASGYCVGESISAANKLTEKGVSVRLLDMFTIKPIDAEAVKRAATDTGCIVTAENHSVINGLGSAVSEILVQNDPVPVEMVGVKDEFGEVGPMSYLRKRFHLTDDDIVESALRVLARKK